MSKGLLLTVWGVAVLLVGCAGSSLYPAAAVPYTEAEQEQHTQALVRWLDQQYETELQFSPISLTMQGRKDQYDGIDDLSEEAAAEQLAWKAASVAEMQAKFDYSKLSADGQDSYDLWAYQYQVAKQNWPFRHHSYVFEQTWGMYSFAPNFLINFHQVDSVADMQAYVSRIKGMARALSQQLESAKLAAASGIRPPRFAFDGVIEQCGRIIAGQPFLSQGRDAALWADAKSKIEKLVQAGKLQPAQASRLQEQARLALLEEFQPVYLMILDWLHTDRERASAQAQGVWALPDGAAYYAERLASMTTTPLSADEIHRIGLAEVARIRAQMEQIKEQMNFSGSLQEFFVFLREDAQFYYPNTDAGREAYLKDSRRFLEEITQKIPDYFGILPKAKLVVKRVESFRERDGGAQHYRTGTPDGSRPGIYYAHLSDMSAYSSSDMETTAYHEGNPGHHMQQSIAQERTDLPKFRTQAGFTVYLEGWALYAEKLSLEMGAYKDPYKRFGHLTAEMWRAIRLVVDTGLHAKKWTQEQAVQYFLDNSAIPEAAVRSEVRRYLVSPGQATSYKMGMLRIQELRAQAERSLGEKFDIRGFHDVILGGGAMPMPILSKRVQRWIQEQAS